MVDPDPSRRPSLVDVINNDFFGSSVADGMPVAMQIAQIASAVSSQNAKTQPFEGLSNFKDVEVAQPGISRYQNDFEGIFLLFC